MLYRFQANGISIGANLIIEIWSLVDVKSIISSTFDLIIKSNFLVEAGKPVLADEIIATTSSKELNVQSKINMKDNPILGLEMTSLEGDNEAVNVKYLKRIGIVGERVPRQSIVTHESTPYIHGVISHTKESRFAWTRIDPI